jgi:uncharacterized protein (TIGR03437 family)
VVAVSLIPETVQFAGLVFPGEFQFNVYIPANVPSGDNALTATYNGVSTPSGVFITVHN